MRKPIAFLVVIYLLSQAFDSTLRWALDLVHLAPLIYLRDAGLVLAVMLGLMSLSASKRNILPLFCLLWFLGVGICVSLCSGLGIAQILFGAKVWLPFVAGFVLFETHSIELLNRPKRWLFVWALMCAGIIINKYYRFPWVGLALQVGDLAVTGNREWNAMGVPRLSGFSRSSYDAATMILIVYIYLACFLRGKILKVVLTLVSALAIALTTSKGAVGAFIAVFLTLLLFEAASIFGLRVKALLVSGLCFLAFVGAVLPLISLQLPIPQLRQGTTEQWLLSSFADRAWATWPKALELLSDWQTVLGRGIGGIGVSQQNFEPGLSSPADNIFVYLYVTAGLVGVGLYVFCILATTRMSFDDVTHRAVFLMLFSIYADGLTSNQVESAPTAVAFGVLVGLLLSVWTFKRTASICGEIATYPGSQPTV